MQEVLFRGKETPLGGKKMTDYIRLESSVHPIYDESDDDLCLVYNNGRLIVKSIDEEIKLLRGNDLNKLNLNLQHIECIGAFDGDNCYKAEVRDDCNLPSEYREYDLKPLTFQLEEEAFLIAAKGLLLLNWEKTHKYCGVCGFPMEKKKSDTERALICPACGYTTWPRTSPAIIVAVTKGDQLLLAHNKNFSVGMYSVIAGFVELGETFEQCVKREVFEEVGIQVDNIKYFGNQPWPFPNSMMVAYTAEYAGGDIKVDNDEITHADWFSKEEIPGMYRETKSIGSELISWFIKTH